MRHGWFDVVVVGSGHAAVEASLAASRLGLSVAIITLNSKNVAGMPCNPSIGGPGKAQMVSEIDALGGEMALACDEATLSLRVLNQSKGPAVRSLRAQVDKNVYRQHMQRVLALAGVEILQGNVEEVILDENGRAGGVRLTGGHAIPARAVILCTGVYLESRIIIGEEIRESGPLGEPSARGLSACLRGLGLKLGRFKTGTSPRLKKASIKWDRLKAEKGTDQPLAFSFMSEPRIWEQDVCYSTYTNQETHRIIRHNIWRAPLFDGTIQGTGPRYCPSIEDKVMRFPKRQRHQVYLEMECNEDDEVYLLGLSTSLPVEVQYMVVRSLSGMEEAEITRPGYAIEYDYLTPSELRPTLETKAIPGLFTAGQINGTSGYEEAAAQGLMAGINAVGYLTGSDQIVLGRDEAYIGVMIDDIVNTRIEEPYRILTSRAEYRLLLRQSNADSRLTPLGRRIGLVSDERWSRFQSKRAYLRQGRALLEEKVSGQPISDLLRNPENNLADFAQRIPEILTFPPAVFAEIEIEAKYAGFIRRQEREAARLKRYLGKKIPSGLDLNDIPSLSREGRDKIANHRPSTLGRALEIGVSPTDVLVILAHLEHGRGRRGGETL
ncbi:MAG: tRNA uridine-5-carboxymethylaminomethyl(34) synthesis enzyme MnmG [Bacillota bacterium]